jgi:hypothetical protein
MFNLFVTVFNIWFASVIFRNKNLQAHPMKLFAYISLAEALYYGNQFAVYNTCFFKLPQLFSYTVYWSDASYSNQYRALYLFFISQTFIEILGLWISLLLNFCLVMDLVIMITNPFDQKEKYMTMYVWSSGLLAVIFSATMDRSVMIDFQSGEEGWWAIFIAYWILFFFAIGSLIFAYKSLSKPGISQAARSLVLKRHAAGIAIFLITNLYVTALTFYILLKIPVPTTSPAVIIFDTLKTLYFLEGVLSPLIRLNEPAFR